MLYLLNSYIELCLFVISRLKLFPSFLKVSCQSGTLPCFPCFPCVWARVAQQQRRGLHERPPARAVGRAGPAFPPAGLEPAPPPCPILRPGVGSPYPVPAPSPGRAWAARSPSLPHPPAGCGHSGSSAASLPHPPPRSGAGSPGPALPRPFRCSRSSPPR